MRPPTWHPPVEPTPEEQQVMKLIKRAKLFVFLRERRHELFEEGFQAQLATIYCESRLGQPPVPPAKLALVTILQAYTGVSDDEAIEGTTMDRRWQLALDCLDEHKAPFSKGTLVNFRKALIEHGFDRCLIERTVELARRRGGFGSGRLRAALDSSPLWGAGRVEDTYNNLLGHALRKALGVIARQQGRGLADVAEEAGAEVVASGASLKAALDLDWDDPEERARALVRVLNALDAIEKYPDGELREGEAEAAIETARRVREQDVEESAEGPLPALRRGVARERRVSVKAPEMRHGRKSRSRRFEGYKRHVLRDLETGSGVGGGGDPGERSRGQRDRAPRPGSRLSRGRTRRTTHIETEPT